MIAEMLGISQGEVEGLEENPELQEVMSRVLNPDVLKPTLDFLAKTYEKYNALPDKTLAALLLLAKRHPEEFVSLLKGEVKDGGKGTSGTSS